MFLPPPASQKRRIALTVPMIIGMATDATRFKKHAFDYAQMFYSIFKLDNCVYTSAFELPRFSISELIEDLGKLPKNERDAINKYFGLTGPKHYMNQFLDDDKAMREMFEEVVAAAAKIRTAEKMYRYNKWFREGIDKTAKKVHDPEGKYTALEKAKFAHVYYWFIKDFQFMPYDETKTDQLLDDEEVEDEKTQFPSLDSYVVNFEEYFKNLPDGDIVIPQIADFIWNADEDLDRLMVEFAELYECKGLKGDHEKQPSLSNRVFLCQIREAKERLFPNGKWNGDYMTLSGFANMPINTVEGLISAYRRFDHVYEQDPSRCPKKCKIRTFFRTLGDKEIKVPRYSDTKNFVDDIEMAYFVNIIHYIENNVPQFMFHGRPFKEYGYGKKVA